MSLATRTAGALLLALALLCSTIAHVSAQADAVVAVQVLDFEKGFIFFTTGDGFRVAPAVAITDYRTGASAQPPQSRDWARVTFDQIGNVIKIQISKAKLPAEGDLSAIRRFAVALSTSQPNPDLAPRAGAPSSCANVRPGKSVTLNITVQVPPSTPLTDTVYMTTDQSGWNAQAYRMDRRDVLHYRTQLKLLSGTVLHLLFDRGSMQSVQLAENGIEQSPYTICIGDEDAQTFTRTVYHWADQQAGASLPIPLSMPTPYNPAPFPNLPTPQPRPTSPHRRTGLPVAARALPQRQYDVARDVDVNGVHRDDLG